MTLKGVAVALAAAVLAGITRSEMTMAYRNPDLSFWLTTGSSWLAMSELSLFSIATARLSLRHRTFRSAPFEFVSHLFVGAVASLSVLLAFVIADSDALLLDPYEIASSVFWGAFATFCWYLLNHIVRNKHG